MGIKIGYKINKIKYWGKIEKKKLRKWFKKKAIK